MMRLTIAVLFVVFSGCKSDKKVVPRDATCSEVGQWALDRCVTVSDEPCVGVYKEAAEACHKDVEEGREVCVPRTLGGCRAYVSPRERPAEEPLQ